jgi:glutamyl-tRNA reductase
MKLLITGLSHHTALVEVREKLARRAGSPGALTVCAIGWHGGRHDSLTCNRGGGYAEESSAAPRIGRRIFGEARSGAELVSSYLHHYTARRQTHLPGSFEFDSMIVGGRVPGQLKNAYMPAKEHGSVNGFLDLVMTRAFNVAKRVRTETEIGSSAVSVSYAAVELARDIFGSLSGKRVLLVGAGKMAESAARHLRRAGVSEILVTNRTRSRADALAEEFHGRVVEYDEMAATLPDVDIVIASSGAPHFILTKELMQGVINRRRHRPMFLIDIAVPRTSSPP